MHLKPKKNLLRDRLRIIGFDLKFSSVLQSEQSAHCKHALSQFGMVSINLTEMSANIDSKKKVQAFTWWKMDDLSPISPALQRWSWIMTLQQKWQKLSERWENEFDIDFEFLVCATSHLPTWMWLHIMASITIYSKQLNFTATLTGQLCFLSGTLQNKSSVQAKRAE